jgi:hypothetical protein
MRIEPGNKPGLRAMKPRKGIHRAIHHISGTGSWVAIIYRVSGKASKTFTDSVYGGSKSAYRAASAWYVQMSQRFPLANRVDRMLTLRGNNRSGITGVYRWPANGDDREGAYWGAQWVVTPWEPPVRRKFSIACYGERQAKKLAIQARNAALTALRAAENE